MKLIDPELDLAEARAQRARKRLTDTLVALQARLNPRALAKEAAEELKEAGEQMLRNGVEAVKQQPVKAAGVAAAVGLFLLRKPLRKLAERAQETPAPSESLTTKRAPPRRRGKKP